MIEPDIRSSLRRAWNQLLVTIVYIANETDLLSDEDWDFVMDLDIRFDLGEDLSIDQLERLTKIFNSLQRKIQEGGPHA